jgi:hypothetical protein
VISLWIMSPYPILGLYRCYKGSQDAHSSRSSIDNVSDSESEGDNGDNLDGAVVGCAVGR